MRRGTSVEHGRREHAASEACGSSQPPSLGSQGFSHREGMIVFILCRAPLKHSFPFLCGEVVSWQTQQESPCVQRGPPGPAAGLTSTLQSLNVARFNVLVVLPPPCIVSPSEILFPYSQGDVEGRRSVCCNFFSMSPGQVTRGQVTKGLSVVAKGLNVSMSMMGPPGKEGIGRAGE